VAVASSAQEAPEALVAEAARLAACGVSVSAGSRGTISYDSASGSSVSEPGARASHELSAVALPASGPMLVAAGAVGSSAADVKLLPLARAEWSSVRPAVRMVGSDGGMVAEGSSEKGSSLS